MREADAAKLKSLLTGILDLSRDVGAAIAAERWSDLDGLLARKGARIAALEAAWRRIGRGDPAAAGATSAEAAALCAELAELERANLAALEPLLEETRRDIINAAREIKLVRRYRTSRERTPSFVDRKT
ncbi:MAG: hypothetical protein HYV63_15050 [Candidatus Schekmanbacteria bacterium]|nr:hypothetical protein [Candidatus Schekmanbacteria bacterium]